MDFGLELEQSLLNSMTWKEYWSLKKKKKKAKNLFPHNLVIKAS